MQDTKAAPIKSKSLMPKKGPDATVPEPETATQGKQRIWGRLRGRAVNPRIQKENPMSLGVLNNLSAVYAENNLNNSNNNLNTVLQQLSSGSKINSGADDAAGLSLVDGLQANQQALTQSETNATEGAGLLQVADGALSQVTSLLNRAVTLATEASNGTLNSSQDTAANQEYQSILSEISNIGSTTTYNQEAVFNSNTNIYTGDSSATGASIDSLNIRSLSSSNVGDSGGAISYSSGSSQGNVFINLESGTHNAALTDTLNASGTTDLTLTTLSGTSNVTHTIAVGTGTGYSNTVSGMLSAINNSGLGVTASFTTAAVAGVTVGSTAKGIEITGGVGVGTSPSAASFSGSIAASGTLSGDGGDVMSGAVTLQVGTGAATTVTTSQVATADDEAANAVTMTQLASYITADSALGVSASVDATSGALDLNTTGATTGLKVSDTLSDNTLTTSSGAGQAMSYTATAAYSVGVSNEASGESYSTSAGSVVSWTGTGVGTFDSTTYAANNAGASLGPLVPVAPTPAAGTSTAGSIATISYTDAAGQSLASTDLTNQANAETALTSLNSAITAVAAQDGYIGAQINTLNAVSQVLGTQQENVQSAQNAVQATDYASATSNMSKYEILSQTGISALAQANSMQQEVTKLLQ
jgi:flagellin